MHPPAPSPAPSQRLAKSAIVGVAATLVDLLVLGALVELAGVPTAWANVPALTLGLVVQFVGNKVFAFGDRSTGAAALARQGSLFIAIEAVAFLLNAGLFHLLTPVLGLPWWLGRVAASAAVYFGFSYRLWALIFQAPAALPTGDRQ